MSDLFDDDEDVDIPVNTDTTVISSNIIPKTEEKTDARRKLEAALEERRLRRELADFIEDE